MPLLRPLQLHGVPYGLENPLRHENLLQHGTFLMTFPMTVLTPFPPPSKRRSVKSM